MRTLLLVFLVACGSTSAAPKPPPPTGPSPEEVAFDAALDAFYAPHFAYRPHLAIELGDHGYDGKLGDRSPEAIAAELERLRDAERTFAANVPATRAVEGALVLAEIRRELFDLEVRRRPWREVFPYLHQLSLSVYIARDYAPLADRARALLASCEAAPGYLAQMEANLEPVVAKSTLEGGIGALGGQIAFVTKEVPAAFAALDDETLAYDLSACLTRLADAFAKATDALKARLPAATTEFALGEDTLLALLREAEGIDLTYDQLDAAFRADLERNRAAITAAAGAIDGARDPREVIAEVSAEVPADAIADATMYVGSLREFVVERGLVPVPDAVAEVREAPSFFRNNFAFISTAGPRETVPLPSIFYLALPFPMSTYDLMFIAAHEVWPGHFVQNMAERTTGKRVLETFETTTASEGWAHYVEEMMWDEGFGGGQPRAHIGMLKNALLRDVRALVALGYHARGMTIDEATAMFTDQAFADPTTAKQQAMRGTTDPMFLSYTLGKLIIMKLRADWMAAHPGATLREFHDAFLAHGEAPLPAIRRAMLGAEDSGSLL